MFEFKKLCNEFENLDSAERGLLLTEKSVKILAKIKLFDLPVDPISALAGFIVGSVVADGKINEKEYLLIYPSLVKAFGYDFDFQSVKQSFASGSARKIIADYTKQMIQILSFADDELRCDVITLCLCVTALDGKISFREKQYIRRLCKA